MTFEFPLIERVVSGANSVDGLADELDRRKLSRVVVVTGRSLGASPLLQRVTGPIGDRCVHVFNRAKQHVPSCSVAELVHLVEQQRADCLVSFGGGSPIDTVKAAIHAWLDERQPSAPGGDAPAHIAISTTLSAGEFTSVVGITDERTRIKRAIHDARLAPHTVYMDPTLTLETPHWLWAASGIRALDHAVESMYSARHHPLSDAVASRGLALLVKHLPASLASAGDAQLEHRLQCHMGAWMAVFGMTNAGFGLSHALGHQIGPRWNVAHGVTSCITLPHAMRFMAQRAPARFQSIAGALGVDFVEAEAKRSAQACADRIESFVAALGLPQRLRDVGVPIAQIGEVAVVVHGIMEGAHAVDGIVTCAEIEALLMAAY